MYVGKWWLKTTRSQKRRVKGSLMAKPKGKKEQGKTGKSENDKANKTSVQTQNNNAG